MILRWKMAQWFEAWWWKRYLNDKPVEAYLSWKKDYWRNFLAQTQIEIDPAEQILDAGCGPAGIFMVLPDNEVKAIDPLLNRYRVQLPHFQSANFPKVKFDCRTLESLSEEEAYDLVFCLNALNHVHSVKVSLQNLYASLREGGRIFLSVDAHRHKMLKRIFRLIPGDILHPHQLELSEYLGEVKKVGFKIERTKLLKEERIFDYHLIEARK